MIDKIVEIKKIHHKSKRYDIGVADNNNLFANGLLVHNCQNLPNMWDILRFMSFEVTEKVDGTSFTAYYNNKEFGVCSRSLNLCCTEGNTYWEMAAVYGIEATLARYFEKYSENLAIQGEIIGEGIQKNRLAVKGRCLKVFDLYSIDKKRYLDYKEREQCFDKLLECQDSSVKKLEHVPIITIGNMLWELTTIDDILKYAEGNSLVNPNKKREGVAFKSRVIINNYGESVSSFKAINNNYLLANED